MIKNEDDNIWKNEEMESVETIMRQQSGNFIVKKNESNINICHRIDKQASMLSSRKLWDIIRLANIEGCELDRDFMEEVKSELKLRNEYTNTIPWKRPH